MTIQKDLMDLGNALVNSQEAHAVIRVSQYMDKLEEQNRILREAFAILAPPGEAQLVTVKMQRPCPGNICAVRRYRYWFVGVVDTPTQTKAKPDLSLDADVTPVEEFVWAAEKGLGWERGVMYEEDEWVLLRSCED